MKDPKLIGYFAMIEFLTDHSERNSHPDEIQALLGQLFFLEDGTPADPASEKDWKDAYEKAEMKMKKDYILKFE